MGIVSVEKYQDLAFVNPYIFEMAGEFKDWTVDHPEAATQKGRWRDSLGVPDDHPLDLEIGVGNGFFFAHLNETQKDRCFLGIEIKFKPLIQTVRRTLKVASKPFRVLRVQADQPQDFFADGEINNVFIFFPDPWPKKRAWKHRLIQDAFLSQLHRVQKSGSLLEIKTDNRDYFDWIVERVERSQYQVERKSYDFHKSEWAAENFMTHFERLWTSKGLPTHYLRLRA